MSRRGTGTTFFAIAAFLFAMRFISAAIFGSSMMGWSSGNYEALLDYVGSPL